jgi:hypothetical protein
MNWNKLSMSKFGTSKEIHREENWDNKKKAIDAE